MSFKVTVCGSSGGYPAAGRACAGYLLSKEENTLMLDIGAGSLSNMLEYIEADVLGGLAITHMHYDHYTDIYGLCTARRFWENALSPMPTLGPSTAKEIIGSPLSEESREEFFKCLDLTVPDPGNEIDFFGFSITTGPSSHVIPGLIYRIRAGDSTVCYSGDTERCPTLMTLADKADLFICEATFTSQVPARQPGHMSASEAGQVAHEAGVRRLLLTHVWPTLDPDRAIEDAAKHFKGPIDLALEGLTIFVGPYPCAV